MGDRPYTLTAELTYRCPLHCAYCSNPISYEVRPAMDTEHWCRLFAEAEAIEVMQVNSTGGEPLLRSDLELSSHSAPSRLVDQSHHQRRPLSRSTAQTTGEWDWTRSNYHFSQIAKCSRQSNRWPGGRRKKLAVARWTHALRIPLTLNIVLHRQNIEEVRDIIAWPKYCMPRGLNSPIPSI